MTDHALSRPSRKRTLTPEALFDYACGFAKDSEMNDRGTQYPTFRQAARHFRVKLSQIEEACQDYQGDGYLKPAVGFRNYSGHGSYEHQGDWLVEAYA